MKNILLPSDFSKNSLNAIHYAMDLLKDEPCNFYILNVQKASSFISDDIIASNTSTTIYNTLIDAAKKSIENIISIVTSEYQNDKHEFFSIVDYDNFIDAINQISDEYQIDFIIMGTKGASGLGKKLFGSNTVRVIQRCKTPVLVIPDACKFKTIEKIAFTTNNLALFNSKEFRVMQHLWELSKAQLNIIHVADEHHLAQNQERNEEFFKTYFPEASHDYIDSNSKHIFEAIQNYIAANNIELLAMMNKKHSFIERLFTKHMVETFAFKIDIPFLVLQLHTNKKK
ncbi:universal stress protein [Tamlana fucoidanivorans]|uniref:Universal stress protein n=1 Tax=Allotamlana fucoidanivorans TaxID=2583814 RepID=A0A5C4SJI5_9FLAO|nr:universal stress protein [Tamlana fucoidanivorans]TNJ43126.1 universal stress protein [Tamlana fucoidanivorans]